METSEFRITSVEEPIVLPRSREVWMPEDQKVLNRAIRLLMSRGLSVDLRCLNAECFNNTITREQSAGGFELLCGCKRRVFNRPTQSYRVPA